MKSHPPQKSRVLPGPKPSQPVVAQLRELFPGNPFSLKIMGPSGALKAQISSMSFNVVEVEATKQIELPLDESLLCDFFLPGRQEFSGTVSVRKISGKRATLVVSSLAEWKDLIRVNQLFCVSASASHPVFYREHLHFQISGFGPDSLELCTSKRNSGLIPGVELELVVPLAKRGVFTVSCQVSAVQVPTKETDPLRIQVKYSPLEHIKFAGAVSEHLVAFGHESLLFLRRKGFFVPTIEKAISVRQWSGSSEEWDDILSLRFKSYRSAGKFLDATKPSELSDARDSRALHLIAKVGGRLIACSRILNVEPGLRYSEHIALGVEIPDFLSKEGFIEVSRACVDPEFRGTELLLRLVQHTGQVAYSLKKRYIVMNCNEDLWPFYEKAGCVKTGVVFTAYGKDDCNLIYCDIERLVRDGRGGGVLGWHEISFQMTQFLSQNVRVVSYLTKFKMVFHKCIEPVVRYFRFRRARQKWEKRFRRLQLRYKV